MTDLEPLLRQHFSAEADRVPFDANLLGGVETLRHVRRRRRVLGGGVTLGVAIVAAAIAVPLGVIGHHGGATRVTVSPNQPAVPATPPPGERAVTWAGIQLYVPATWPSVASDPHRCAKADHPGGEVDYESSAPVAVFGCTPASHPVLEFLELGTAYSLDSSGYTGEGALSHLEPGTLAGLAAGYARATIRGQFVTSVRVPSLGTVFTLTTDTRARADDMLASAHRVSVDENGCAVDQPADLKKVAGGGAGGAQVRGTPVSGVVCSYTGGRLVMGVTLTAKQLGALTADLDRLPPRYTAAELAAQRAPSALDRGGLASIMLTVADGRTQQITVQGPLAGVRPGVAGATQSTLTQALFGDLVSLFPSGFGADAIQTGPTAVLPAG